MPSKFQETISNTKNPLQDAINNQQSKSQETKKEKEKRTCLANGGVWDEATQSCSFPDEDKSKIGTFRDSETGRLSGFERGGKTYLGAGPQDVTDAVTQETLKQELPVGGQAETVLANRQQQELQQQGLQSAAEVGGQLPQNELEQLKSGISAGQVNYLSAAASALPGIIPDALSFGSTLAGGALLAGQLGPQAALPEEIVTVPAAAVIGGIIGGIKGFYSDFVSDVKRQKREIIETPIRTLTETKSILNDIVSAQNANPSNAIDNQEAFNSQLALIDLEYERLKRELDSDLNKFLGEDGIDQLQEYEVYYIPNGERDQQIREFQIALSNPDPARIRANDITLEKLRKYIEDNSR